MTATQKTTWPLRLAGVRRSWPSTEQNREQVLDAIADYDLLGRVMRDVLRVGYEPPRRGQRSPLEWSDGQARLRSLAAERSGLASNLPFGEAFARLADGHSVDAMADSTGLHTWVLDALLEGQRDPTAEEMVAIADAFGKPPTYFLEYRITFICAAMATSLLANPERTIDVLVRLGAHPDELDG